MAGPILKLSTLAPDRPVVEIDGKRLVLRSVVELGLRDSILVDRLQRDFFRLAVEVSALTDEQLDELGEVIERLLDRVLPNESRDIAGGLVWLQKMQLIEVFFRAAHPTTPRTLPRKMKNGAAKRKKLTPPTFSRGSNDSTAATRSAG